MRKCRIQLAFNSDISDFYSVANYIPKSENIIIEAGTPLIKKYGIQVVADIRRYWGGEICADMKIIDGAVDEVNMAVQSGATSVTAMGNATKESLTLFVDTCKKNNVRSIIDMMNVENPMRTLWKNRVIPNGVFIHRGRDEENAYGKIIQYKDIAKIKGKWEIQMGAAGGIDEREFQSAIFNNADIVVVNVVSSQSPWKGLVYDKDFERSLVDFLKFVK